MPTYPSDRQNKTCRTETVPYIYGQAVTDIPRKNELFSFLVLQMVPEEESFDSEKYPSYSIRYRLEPTGQIVMASNTTLVKVRQGSRIMLVKAQNGYDLFCDCSNHQTGLVIEPSLPMLVPNAPPNFAGTDNNGERYPIEKASYSIGFRNALCTGTLAVEGTQYYPLKATYRGGEQYYDSSGTVQYRLPGEPLLTGDGKPVYLMRRELVATSDLYIDHKENSNQQSISSGTVPEILGYLDSPFKYRYVDGTPCSIGLVPNIPVAITESNWAITTDPKQAQYGYDLFLCPKQAEGEPIPPNTLVNITKSTSTSYFYPMRNKFGQEIKPTDDIVNTAVTPYYEVAPPTDRYFTTLLGQASTIGFNYILPPNPSNGDYPYSFADTSQDDMIITNCDTLTSDQYTRSSQHKKVYANALLMPGGQVQLSTSYKVVNSKATAPSRGVFQISTVPYFFNVLFSLSTERSFGVPCKIKQTLFESGSNKTVTTMLYYEIVRKLIDPLTGKHGLELVPTEPYMSDAEMESL